MRARSLVEPAAGLTYLNTAQCGLLMSPAARAVEEFIAEQRRSGCLPWSRWLERRETARAKIASLIGAVPERLSFVGSTSHALSCMAFLLSKAGLRRILSSSAEFVGTLLPWREYGFEVELLTAPDALSNDEVARAELRRRLQGTDVLVTAHVQSYTGFRCDLQALGALCRETGTLFAVNATQSAGVFEIDVTRDRIDLLAFTGFKWLMAGYGTGVLYLSRDRIASGPGPLVGWMSLENPYDHDLHAATLAPDGRSLEAGVPDFSRAFALEAAVEALQDIGLAAVRARVLELVEQLHSEADRRGIEVTSPRTTAHRSGIVLLALPAALELQRRLAERGVVVSAKEGGLRIAPHCFNTDYDILELFRCLDRVLPTTGAVTTLSSTARSLERDLR